jgi:hypothetical protein
MCAEYGLRERQIPPESWIFTLVTGHSYLKRDRHMSLDKIRSLGFNEELQVGEGHFIGFGRMVAANIIPKPENLLKGTHGL